MAVRRYKTIRHGTYEGFVRGCDCDDCWGEYKKISEARRAVAKPLGEKTTGGPVKHRTSIKHGTIYAYQGWKCRCEKCRECERLRSLKYKRRRGQRPQAEYFEELRAKNHGTFSRYRKGCRCEKCTAYHKMKCHEQYMNTRDKRLKYAKKKYWEKKERENG